MGRGPGGAARGPAGRVPGGRDARLSAQPGRLGKQHGDPAPPPPRHPAHAPLSNQNGSSPGPGREAGPPPSQVLPEGHSPLWAPGRPETARGPFPRLERPRAEEPEQGVSAQRGGGGCAGVQPRRGRGGRGNNAGPGTPTPTDTHSQWGPPPRRWGAGAALLKAAASALGLGGRGEEVRGISARGASRGDAAGVEGGGRRAGAQAKPRRPGGREELAGRGRRGAGLRCSGVSLWLFRGGGRTLTGESFDGLHGPVLVGAVHEGIAGLDQELAAVGDLVLRKHFLQVRGGHALVEVADVQLVHGGGLGARRGPWQGRAGGRGRRAS